MLMGDIYIKVVCIFVWLGCLCCLLGVLNMDWFIYFEGKWFDYLVGIDFFFKVIEILGNEVWKFVEEGCEVVLKQGEKDEDGMMYDCIKKLKFKWNVIFLENLWWICIWMLQEIVFVKEVCLCMERYELGWDFFCVVIFYYIVLGFGDFFEIYVGSKINFGVELFNLVNVIREVRQFGLEFVIEDVGDEFFYYFVLFYWCDCKMFQDKIFGLMGLFSEGCDVGIEVDYWLDVEDVYC